MKNVINYYYELFPDDIHQKDKKFFFQVNDKKYVFLEYNEDSLKLQKIDYITNLLNAYDFQYNRIIKNNNDNIVTFVSNIPHILIEIIVNDQNSIIIPDLIRFQQFSNVFLKDKINILDISKMWMNKIDYLEYQISQFGLNFPVIRYSINYFIGLAENAIMLLNATKKSDMDAVISHFRVSYNMNITNLYNCLNFVIDTKIRDIAEYIKSKMFFTDVIEETIYYLKYSTIDNDDALLFFARILFPTHYFDICEDCIRVNDDNNLNSLISKINIFEKNIRSIYYFLYNNYQIPRIDWLI